MALDAVEIRVGSIGGDTIGIGTIGIGSIGWYSTDRISVLFEYLNNNKIKIVK